MANLEFQIRNFDDKDQPFYWRVVLGSEVLARSENMANKEDCESAAQTVKNGDVKGYFSWQSDKDKKYRWRVRGNNNEIMINSTDSFDTKPGSDAVANKVKDNARFATIVDQTKAVARY